LCQLIGSLAFGSYFTTANIALKITKADVAHAQKLWGEGVVAIGKHCKDNDERKCQTFAASMIDKMYAYDISTVLFKPTMASETRDHRHHEFRLDRDAAISYFVGGNVKYTEDKGFARRPWSGEKAVH
jgi:hypothetical protein